MIGGANYYPNDIEFVVQECHPALASGRGAAFAITPGLGTLERLVVVQELDRRIDAAELAELLPSIRAAISSHHAVTVHSVVLVDRSSIPTTSSGKVQRSLCRRQFLDGEIAPVAQWQVPSAPEDLAKARTLEAATAAADLIRTALAERQAAERGG